MKKFFATIFALLVLCSVSHAGTLSFGYGKNLTWSGFTRNGSGVQDVNCSATSGTVSADGYLMASFTTPTFTKLFTNLTGMNIVNSGSPTTAEIISNMLSENTGATSGDHYIAVTKDPATSGNPATSSWLRRVDVYSTSTNTGNDAGTYNYFADNTYDAYWDIRSDGNHVTTYKGPGNGGLKNFGTTLPLDTSRFHMISLYYPASNSGILVYDGTEICVTGETRTYSGGAGDFAQWTRRYSADAAQQPRSTTIFLKHHTSLTPYVASGATMESSTGNSNFDAGAGNQWTNVAWTATTNRGTCITMEARTAGSLGGLSSASYSTIANSGDGLATSAECVELRITLNTTFGGRYTPVLQDVTLTSGTAPVTVVNPYFPKIITIF